MTSSWSIFIQLNGTHQLLTYAHDNISGGSIHTIKKNTEALLVCSKQIGIEVNIDKTKYMVMSRDQNAGRSHNIKIYNNSLKCVEEFKYWETTYQNFIQEGIKNRLKSGNACCNLVRNILSSGLLSKSLMIKIFSTIIMLAVLNGY